MIKDLLKVIVLTVLFYVLFANISYGFRHPEMTDMQRMSHFMDMLEFK